MDPILLMDKKDQLSFEILSLINRAADAPVNMDHVADKLGVSSYKLQRLAKNGDGLGLARLFTRDGKSLSTCRINKFYNYHFMYELS